MIIDRRKVTIIVIGIVVVLALLLLNQLRLNAMLRIKESDPAKTLPTSQRDIRLTFNRDLNKKAISTKNISVEGNIDFVYTVDGPKLNIRLAESQKEDSTVIVHLNNITAADGKTMSRTLKYKVAYVPFDKLSEAEKKLQTESSNSFEDDFPLIAELPYIGTDFSIDYTFPPENETRMPIIVTSTAINFEDPLAAADSPSNLSLLRTTRTNAMTWLKEQGFDEKKYRLYFGENLLLEEFKGEYNAAILTDEQ